MAGLSGFQSCSLAKMILHHCARGLSSGAYQETA